MRLIESNMDLRIKLSRALRRLHMSKQKNRENRDGLRRKLENVTWDRDRIHDICQRLKQALSERK